jgi:hypothetical protein
MMTDDKYKIRFKVLNATDRRSDFEQGWLKKAL